MSEVEIIKKETRHLKAQVVSSIHELMEYMHIAIDDTSAVRKMTQAIVNNAISTYEED